MNRILIRVLVVLYIIFYLAVPCLIMCASFFFDDYAIQRVRFMRIILVLSISISLPIFIICTVKMFKILALKTIRRILFLFIPFVVNKVLYFYNYSSIPDIMRVVMLDGIVLFIGIYQTLLIGLMVLLYNYYKSKPQQEDAKPAFIGLTILLLLLYTPVIYFFVIGWKYSLDYSSERATVAIAKYFLSIVVVVLFNYKTAIELYKRDNSKRP